MSLRYLFGHLTRYLLSFQVASVNKVPSIIYTSDIFMTIHEDKWPLHNNLGVSVIHIPLFRVSQVAFEGHSPKWCVIEKHYKFEFNLVSSANISGNWCHFSNEVVSPSYNDSTSISCLRKEIYVLLKHTVS